MGDRVAKHRWDTTLDVDQAMVDLTLSPDARGMALLGPLILVAAAALALLRGRTPPPVRRGRNHRRPRDNGARI